MNILIDNHHSELTYSLEILFGRRLGHTVFYPIGLEWFERGAWHVYPHRDTALQYLSLSRRDPTVYERPAILTGRGFEKADPNLDYCYDITKDVYERGIRFEKFLDTPVDVLVASIPQHVACFKELIRKYKPKTKLIFQMGNMYTDFYFQGVRNVLNSTERRVPFYINSVTYSQEFELKDFRYTPPVYGKKIVNLAHYTADTDTYQNIKKRCRSMFLNLTAREMKPAILPVSRTLRRKSRSLILYGI